MWMVFGRNAPRPRLAAAVAIGILTGFACLAWTPASAGTCLIIGWDVACLSFIAAALHSMIGRTPDQIRQRAAADDQARATILGLVIVASVGSLAATAFELSLAKHDPGFARGARVWLAFATVAASWFMVQMIFAIHYAHGYYDKVDEGDAGGLEFPGGEDPDYWDFLHFSIIIGVASQTADIDITSKSLRRLGTLHSLLTFTFNTVVVALTINMVAGLF
ncbi:DUF1345 domain-containing protein [Phenylobacterium sp.]|uniref:DUF1345 domain-containing protein n=1 Tax=Phenylobacterium sp. TaxID=1871053 RepID=UPI0027367BE9|nr:DUF1345 domain-containing protein [Phenylobacterium sp.]MDP3659417.1 DUF1345 domain-containing protein [Phenylobacterium sp.]